jgi:hypothetical protein
MSEMRILLKKLDAVMQDSADLRNPAEHHLQGRRLSQHRLQISNTLAEIARASGNENRLKTDAAIDAEFRSRFGELRRTLSDHQVGWSAERMIKEPSLYTESVNNAGQSIASFVAWGSRVF